MTALGIPLAEILEAVEVAREKGWKVVSHLWIDHIDGQRVCCALGACVVQGGGAEEFLGEDFVDAKTIAAVLKIDRDWAAGFADGFDGRSMLPAVAKTNVEHYAEGHAAGLVAREPVLGAEVSK